MAPSEILNGLYDFSISVWFKTTTSTFALISSSKDSANDNEMLFYASDGNLNFYLKGPSYSFATTVNDN